MQLRHSILSFSLISDISNGMIYSIHFYSLIPIWSKTKAKYLMRSKFCRAWRSNTTVAVTQCGTFIIQCRELHCIIQMRKHDSIAFYTAGEPHLRAPSFFLVNALLSLEFPKAKWRSKKQRQYVSNKIYCLIKETERLIFHRHWHVWCCDNISNNCLIK